MLVLPHTAAVGFGLMHAYVSSLMKSQSPCQPQTPMLLLTHMASPDCVYQDMAVRPPARAGAVRRPGASPG
jgi:hypothetical protein